MSNLPISINFFFEIPSKLLYREDLPNSLYIRYQKLAEKKYIEQIPMVLRDNIEIIRFEKVVTDVSVKKSKRDQIKSQKPTIALSTVRI